MNGATDPLQALARRHPEWRPWLGLVAEARRGIEDPAWHACVPVDAPAGAPCAPLLAKATLQLTTAPATTLQNLFRNAGQDATAEIGALGAVAPAHLDAPAVFLAAINRDEETLKRLACELRVDADAFKAVAMLLPTPFLHAYARRWRVAVADGWSQSYCPVCGAWPAYAEVLGVERRRHLRCGQCGVSWETRCLSCVFCGTTDHRQIGTLVPEQAESNSKVEVCNRCRGYLKVFSVLQASSPENVILNDLATAELDVAAAASGYARPQGSGHALQVALAARSSAQ
jgi:FdhE protein